MFQNSTVETIWIGAYSLESTNKWIWMDNTEFNFNNWGKGQPQTDQNCVSMRLMTGKWESSACAGAKPFICQIKHDPFPITYCPLGWIYYQPTRSCYGMTFRGQKYPIVSTWTAANEYCKNLGSVLPSFHDINEFYVLQAFIISAMRPIWIGLQSIDNSNTWAWSDGSAVDYLPWKKDYGFPLTMDISCGMANISFIENYDCNTKAWVICKQPSH
uniref:C-type lectin domain-containing protein n=1 Tax=Panagrolaimus superbus TaxID=310955 RepID=A0A914Y4P8_9BILA